MYEGGCEENFTSKPTCRKRGWNVRRGDRKCASRTHADRVSIQYYRSPQAYSICTRTLRAVDQHNLSAGNFNGTLIGWLHFAF